jgi:pantetheine-phosphate adenylyltransferase
MENNMNIAIYPGSFDPITLGHLNLIKRASKSFDKLIVCIMVNAQKMPLFTLEERLRHVKTVTQRYPNVEVDTYDGLVAEYAKKIDASVLIRGLRAMSDFERECQMAIINKKINPQLETYFLAADEKYMYLSSSAVKEMARFGACLKDVAPSELIDEIAQKMRMGQEVK